MGFARHKPIVQSIQALAKDALLIIYPLFFNIIIL
jgi:hypothetical protein